MPKKVKSGTSLVLGIAVLLFLLIVLSTCQANVDVTEDFRLWRGRRFGYPWWRKYYGNIYPYGRGYGRGYMGGPFWRTIWPYGGYNRGYTYY